MVAYSFKARFAPPIVEGRKRQTIRADRKRHARPGEALQLYQGMRTKLCVKILEEDPICIAVQPVRLVFSRHGFAELPIVGNRLLSPSAALGFALEDGFESEADMAAFWWSEHRPKDPAETLIHFSGVLIRW